MTSPWERVRAQAAGGKLEVVSLLPLHAEVESTYPIRVCATGKGGGDEVRDIGDTGVLFTVQGSDATLGYVPIVICGLDSYNVPNASAEHGLWIDTNSDGDFS